MVGVVKKRATWQDESISQQPKLVRRFFVFPENSKVRNAKVVQIVAESKPAYNTVCFHSTKNFSKKAECLWTSTSTTTTDLFLIYQLTMVLYVETSWSPCQLFHRTFTIDLTASIESCQSCVAYTTFVGNSVLSFTTVTSELNYWKLSPSLFLFVMNRTLGCVAMKTCKQHGFKKTA